MELFFIGFLILALAAAGWYIFSLRQEKNSEAASQSADQFKQFFKMSLDQQNAMRQQLDLRLKEVQDSMQHQGRNIGERLDTAAKVVNTVNSRLSTLEESNKKIHEVGKDIASLQEILRAPKLRGGLGELFLENLLAQILPQKNFQMQYGFKSGEKVDAVIFLRDSMMVSVDSKFPLENFKKMVEADKEDEKKSMQYRKLFFGDVKKHVDAISSKYILPSEGTMDFALMYVPAENVYYETITKDLENESSVCQYALSKRVIPVSPNTFYIYLQTLLVGLRGMQIEKSAQEILKSLSQLKTDFSKFGEAFELVGTHLNHTSSSYEKSEKSLEKLQSRFMLVEGDDREQRSIEAAIVSEQAKVR